MKTKHWIAGLLLAAATFAHAATNDLSGLLQKGLFEEEANRNLEAAAQAYQSAIAHFDKDRKLGATAVFRLAEVYRKQGKTNEANALHERVVREFADQETVAILSRRHLGDPFAGATAAQFGAAAMTTEEAEEIKRIQVMIRNSPDLINAPGGGGLTPLARAAGAGWLHVAKFLLDNGANVDRKTVGDFTPLHAAASSGHKAMVELLLKRGADPNLLNGENETALHAAATKGFRAVAEVLIAHSANVNATGPTGQTPLHEAVKQNQPELVRLLLAHQSDINAANNEGLTSLHLAVGHGPAIVEMLVEKGADVNAKSAQRTPFLIAAQKGYKEVIELLLAKGADVNTAGPNGDTPLHALVQRADTSLVEALLEKGASPNAASQSGHTPLHMASVFGQKDNAELLLKHGADANAKTSDGETPLDFVIKYGVARTSTVSKEGMIEFLREKGGLSHSTPDPPIRPPSARQESRESKSATVLNFPNRPVIDGIAYSPDANDSKLIAAGFVPARSAHPKVTDDWEQRATADVLKGRSSHSAVWTGKELLVFGGEGMGISFGDGARYDFAKDEWRLLPKENAPSSRTTHSAIWTGKEMFVWGGFGGTNGNDVLRDDGARYNPSGNKWTPVSTQNAPAGRFNHTAVWTGSEMIVWGGYTDSRSWYQGARANAHLNSGGRYHTARDGWKEVSLKNAPGKRFHHVAVWTGKEMIVWGGCDTDRALGDGARYNPATDTWQPLSTKGAPAGRMMPVAVWTGKEMLVWGGSTRGDSPTYFSDGGRYDPATDTWKPLSMENAPMGRQFGMAAWSGKEMIVWGGVNDSQVSSVWDANRYVGTGARYNPAADTWTEITEHGAPPARLTRGVWAGDGLVIFGGYNNAHLNDTWFYSPLRTLYPYVKQ